MLENAATNAPVGLLAELTHRCPLGCAYCSNPLTLTRRREELAASEWSRVLREAAQLGVVQLHLSGGEPAARADLEDIVASASASGLYCNLITSGIGLSPERLLALRSAGLDHVQLSVQDSDEASCDAIAVHRGAFSQKASIAAAAANLHILLTINFVVHRGNVERIADMVALAVAWGAQRVEIAHAQYHGWALKNRAALLSSREQVMQARRDIDRLRSRYSGRIVIDSVIADYYAKYPKPCLGGWGKQSLNVTPAGKVLPCHAAESIPGLEFWSVGDRSLHDIWHHSPAFTAFRGPDWMREPCSSCSRREIDFGGCRCQAFQFLGDPKEADPACHLSRGHKLLAAMTDVSLMQNRNSWTRRGFVK